MVLGLCWSLRSRVTLWKWVMLGASWFFYGYWDWRFVGLLAASSCLNHAAARGMERSAKPHLRRTLLTVAVILNIGSIAFFKYAGFLFEQAFWLRRQFGEPDFEWWLPGFDYVSQIILPVGISFFTFQALSYVVDVYRGRMKTADSLLDFALYLAFFPQLVAGPIVRAVDLVGQVSRPGRPATRRMAGGEHRVPRGQRVLPLADVPLDGEEPGGIRCGHWPEQGARAQSQVME